MKKSCILGLIVAFSVIAGSAMAQSSGGLAGDLENKRGALAVNGPAIGGNVTSDVDVGNVSATAERGSTASNRIGSVTSGSVAGNVDLKVRAKDVTATARENSCAENVIGSVGAAACSGN